MELGTMPEGNGKKNGHRVEESVAPYGDPPTSKRPRGRTPKLKEDLPFAQWFIESGLSRADLAPRLGLTVSGLNQILRGDRQPGGSTKLLIEQVTEGKIKADSWVENKPKGKKKN